MTNGNESAHGYGYCTADGRSVQNEPGLTKREYFAAMAMQGIVSNRSVFNGEIEGNHDGENYDFIAKESVCIADALIKALNETQNQ